MTGLNPLLSPRGAFATLARYVSGDICDQGTAEDPIRIWVPGCGSGAEAYSVALLFAEVLERRSQLSRLCLFATDVDAQAIEVARRGAYPDDLVANVPPRQLREFFVPHKDGFFIVERLRERIVFAVHDVFRDPPFLNLDLIDCSGLGACTHASMRQRLVPLAHYALREDGYLFFGPDRDLEASQDLFAQVDARYGLYRKRPVATRNLLFPTAPARGPERPRSEPPRKEDTGVESTVHEILRTEFTPPSILVEARGHILHIHGRVSPYLQPPQGTPRLNLFDQAHPSVATEVYTIVHQAMWEQRTVERDGLVVIDQGRTYDVDIKARPVQLERESDPAVLVAFEPARRPPADAAEPQAAARSARPAAELERELHATKEALQSTIDELRRSNDQLQSSNEDLVMMNEQLQSANEELEASKRESEALNEALRNVNAELENKIAELERAQEEAEASSERDAQDQLQRRAGVTRLGEMASAVAHEVRNGLAGIRSAVEMIADQVPADSETTDSRMSEIVEEMRRRVGSLEEMVRDLLWFATPREPSMVFLSVRELVGHVLQSLHDDPGMHGVELEVRGDDVTIRADADMVKTALRNVVLNGGQATGAGGRTWVTLERDERECRIGVHDDGPGVSADARARVFEPFFSTKPQGSGLGLTIAQSFVEAHGGTVDMEASPGQGTSVYLRLPLAPTGS